MMITSPILKNNNFIYLKILKIIVITEIIETVKIIVS